MGMKDLPKSTGVVLRPPGHYTALIRQLERWILARKGKKLEVKNLELAVRYLTEARELNNELRKRGL